MNKEEDKEYFLCSEFLVETMKPKEVSKPLQRFPNNVYMARFDYNEELIPVYQKLSPEDRQRFWCQGLDDNFIDIDSFDEKKHKGRKFFDWIFDDLGLIQMSNQAVVIHKVSVKLQINPIELFNRLAK